MTTTDNYKHYIDGSYANLSYDERMYYVNLLIEGDKHDINDYRYWIGDPMKDDDAFNIKDEIINFFSDAFKHIHNKCSPIFKDLCINDKICDGFPEDVSESKCFYIQKLVYDDYSKTFDIEIFYPGKSNGRKTEYCNLSKIELFNDECVDDEIQKILLKHKRRLEVEVEYHENQANRIKEKINRITHRFSERVIF